MSKIDLTVLAEILTKQKLEPGKMREIFEEIHLVLSADEDDEKEPTVKKQHAILVSDPNGVLKGVDLAGWVLQLPEDVSPLVSEERILKAAYAFNATPKGNAHPVLSIGEALETITGPAFKEFELWVKTKSPVQVLRTSNEIPKADCLFKRSD